VNSLASALYSGQMPFYMLLKAFAHETKHGNTYLQAPTLQAGLAQATQEDRPSEPGAANTTGGTAEQFGASVANGAGAAGQTYTPDNDQDMMADAILQEGQDQYVKDVLQQMEDALINHTGTRPK